jgi:hypothetical protein
MIMDEPDPDVSQAELVGVTPAAFAARMDRVRSQLTAGAVQAQQSTRIAPCHRRVRFVVPPWGWVDYTVHLDEPDPQLSAVGVVQPGRRDLQGLADTHDELPVAARAALTGAAGVAAGIAVAGRPAMAGVARGAVDGWVGRRGSRRAGQLVPLPDPPPPRLPPADPHRRDVLAGLQRAGRVDAHPDAAGRLPGADETGGEAVRPATGPAAHPAQPGSRRDAPRAVGPFDRNWRGTTR